MTAGQVTIMEDVSTVPVGDGVVVVGQSGSGGDGMSASTISFGTAPDPDIMVTDNDDAGTPTGSAEFPGPTQPQAEGSTPMFTASGGDVLTLVARKTGDTQIFGASTTIRVLAGATTVDVRGNDMVLLSTSGRVMVDGTEVMKASDTASATTASSSSSEGTA